MSSVTVAPELLVFVLDAAVAVADVDVVDVDVRRRRKDGESSGDVDETAGDDRYMQSTIQHLQCNQAYVSWHETRSPPTTCVLLHVLPSSECLSALPRQ